MKIRFFDFPYVLAESDRPQTQKDKNGYLEGPVYFEHQIGQMSLPFDIFMEIVCVYKKMGEWHEGKFL